MTDDESDEDDGILTTTLPLMSAKNPAVKIGVKACDSQGKVCSKMVYADSTVALTPPTFTDNQITLV